MMYKTEASPEIPADRAEAVGKVVREEMMECGKEKNMVLSKLRRRLALLSIISVLAVSAGCGTFKTYKDSELKGSEVATVSGHGHFWLAFGQAVWIEAVDGKSRGWVPFPSQAKILPGLHWVLFEQISTIGPSGGAFWCVFEIEAAAGHDYRVVPNTVKLPPWEGNSSEEMKKGTVQIEDRVSGQSLGVTQQPTECSRSGVFCREDADCRHIKNKCNKLSGYMFGLCNK